MKKIVFEHITKLSKEEAKMIKGGYINHETDSQGLTYFSSSGAWNSDSGSNCQYDCPTVTPK